MIHDLITDPRDYDINNDPSFGTYVLKEVILGLQLLHFEKLR